MRKYELSVITPLHNTDLYIFQHTFQSMKDQTLGFSNIEWVVVIHNSTEEFKQQIKDLLSSYENVKVFILDNNVRTPSSPRNYALNFATGDYIGFLDGDDKYNPNCLKIALAHLKTSGADICSFRREIELEKATSLVLNEIVFWDQTQEEIIVNKNTWDGEKIFAGMWGIITSKLYKRSFLDKYNLRFDESLIFAEGFAFNMIAYNLAENVCLLPQLIGYVYYINSKSLVQTSVMTDEKIVLYAEGFKKIFDIGLKNGIYMNDIMHNILTQQALVMLGSKDITQETRKRVKELLEPYVNMLQPLKPSKLYTAQRLKDLTTLPRTVILGEGAETGNYIAYEEQLMPVTIQDFQVRTLKSILNNAEGTDYASRYHFSDIVTIEGFRSRVPLSNYDTYQPLVSLSARVNETGIFTQDDITSFSLNYGGWGTLKRLPFIKAHMRPYLENFERYISGKKVFLMFESMPYKFHERNLDRTYTNSLMGLILSEFYGEGIRQSSTRAEITTPVKLLFPSEVLNAGYSRLIFALLERDVDTIYAPNAWILLNTFDMLFKDWESLCDNIEHGRLSSSETIPDDLREQLAGQLHADPKRADEIRKIFKLENKSEILLKIWPKLNKIIADGTGSYKIYVDNLKEYLGSIKLENGFFATTEAFIGRAVEDDKYELDLNSAFYEFMPLDGNKKDILFAHEIQPGQDYSLIVSTLAGLYRYQTNILVRCEEVSKGSVKISKLCPRHYDNFYSIREENVYHAVKMVERELKINCSDFVFLHDDERDKFVLMLEPNGMISQNLLSDPQNKVKKAADLIHKYFSEISPEFKNEELTIGFNEPGTHMLYLEILQFKRNILPDSIEPCHVTDNPRAKKLFLQMKMKGYE